MRKCGSLVVAWNPEQLAQLPSVLQENFDAGDTEAVLLSQSELRDICGPGKYIFISMCVCVCILYPLILQLYYRCFAFLDLI